MLDALIDRVAMQSQGPRIIAGDFNYAVEELGQLRRRHDLGFREVQDVAAHQWGQSVSRTGRGTKRIDHMWLSPELQVNLLSVSVQFDHWADHAAVIARFKEWGHLICSTEWYQPAAFTWPATRGCSAQWNPDVKPTVAYAQVWNQLEAQASSWQAMRGIRIRPVQCGRAQTLEPRPKVDRLVPCRKGRNRRSPTDFHGY